MVGKKVAVTVAVLAGLVAAAYSYYRWRYPYSWSHSCDSILRFALEGYADEHNGAYPAGEATPEASLSLLYPKYAAAYQLAGKTVPVETVEAILERGERLGPETCDWHYVEGLTQNDDSHLAIFWDKHGLGHNGERLPNGGHSVTFLNFDRKVISDAEWSRFLAEQKKLLAERDRQAILGEPVLQARVRLPSGETMDHFDGKWRLEISIENGKTTMSGQGLVPATLRWYRQDMQEGRRTYVLFLLDKGWRSKPVAVDYWNAKASPSSIVFEME